ncbi:MAG TPA: hypothetical protein VKE70_01950, partial [Candidatus Solibacter sp.]|nr:hypothetical protein [Candidatus Solibacter sp.]
VTSIADRGHGGTARFDPFSNSLVLTTVGTDGLDGLSRVSLDGSSTRLLTRNPLAGISFSGIAVLPNGVIVFSREEANSDLWLIDYRKQ